MITIASQPPTGEIEVASAATPSVDRAPATKAAAKAAKKAARKRSRRRHLLRLVAVGAVTVVAAGAVGWWYALPRYRPPLRTGEAYGIDVSNHQGDIDWSRVADADIDYAYIKATEGNDFVDKHFAVNWAQAQKAGINRGAYHFFTLCSPGREQAENFLRTVPTDPYALPPAVDLEWSSCARRPSAKAFQQQLTDFVDLVEERTHQEVVFYVMPAFEAEYPVAEVLPRDRWVRRLQRRPADDEWVVWQASDRSAVKGIGEPVDLDVWRVGS